MTLLVIGSSSANTRHIAALASARGVRVVVDRSRRGPDWIIVADGTMRQEALARYSLPAFRVIEAPEVARDGTLDVEAVRTGITRMVELGPYRSPISASGVALVRSLIPLIRAVLHRLAGQDFPDSERDALLVDKKAARRAARRKDAQRARREATLEDGARARHEAKLKDEGRARRAAERKAHRMAERQPSAKKTEQKGQQAAET